MHRVSYKILSAFALYFMNVMIEIITVIYSTLNPDGVTLNHLLIFSVFGFK